MIKQKYPQIPLLLEFNCRYKNQGLFLFSVLFNPLKPHTQTASLFARVKKGRVLLSLEPWPQCSKNQLQSSNDKNY